MGLSAEQLRQSLTRLSAVEPGFARGIEAVGWPEPRIVPPGYPALLRTILGQQVSVQSALATWARLEAVLGDAGDPAALLSATDEELRGAGLSRQKAAYARSLATAVVSGEIDLERLPADDEAAIADLVRMKGIGRWSAEIYLLLAEGRSDIWPAGDLALQIAISRIVGLPARAGEKDMRSLAERWRPHRSAAAIFAWRHYAHARGGRPTTPA